MNARRPSQSRKEILSLHKRLHERELDKVRETDVLFQPTKTTISTKIDVKHYLGDPLPLPYAIESRSSRTLERPKAEIMSKQLPNSSSAPSTSPSTSLENLSSTPLSPLRPKKLSRIPRSKDILKEQSRIRLRNALRKFQDSQTKDTSYNSTAFTSAEHRGIGKIDQSVSTEDKIITPVLSPISRRSSPARQLPAGNSPTRETKEVHISLMSLFTSPIFTVSLLFLLYYIIKTI